VTGKQKARFRRLVKGLNELLQEVRTEYPDASYFIHGNSFLLCQDDAYGERGRGVDDPVMASETIWWINSGDP